MTNRQHLAVAAFYNALPLWTALSELAKCRYLPVELCLAGQAAVIGAIPLPAGSLGQHHNDLLKLTSNLKPITAPDQEPAFVASDGPLLEMLAAGPAANAYVELSAFISLAQIRDSSLDQHMGNGGIVLLSLTDTPQKQNRGAQVLLRHSRHGVVTHDIALDRDSNS